MKSMNSPLTIRRHVGGQALRAAREQLGWSRLELARRARLSVTAVTDAELHDVASLKTLARLAPLLGYADPLALLDDRRGQR
jgi:transcriptional regulator with XRE-family HTH domain